MESKRADHITTDSEDWVDLHGDYLFQYALSRLGNDDQLAEDIVQETFLSALKTSAKHKGKSSQRTWFVSILRNKIIDHYRKNKRNLFEQVDFQDEEFIENGPRKGQWKDEFAPADWGSSPEKTLEQSEFQQIFQNCFKDLPENIGAVFALREIDGLDSKQVCKELDISSSNLWVILHRARTSLRRCLELNWIESAK